MNHKKREELKEEYSWLYKEITEILFKNDLMGINFENNTDEYEPEVDTILPRLVDAKNKEDVAEIICEEFGRWFGGVHIPTTPAYTKTAKEVWEAYEQYNRQKK